MVTVPALGSGSMASSVTLSLAADSSAPNSLSHGVDRRCTISRAAATSSAGAALGALYVRGCSFASADSSFRMVFIVFRKEKAASPAHATATASSAGAIQRGVRRLRQKSSLISCKGEVPVVQRVEAEVLVRRGVEGFL